MELTRTRLSFPLEWITAALLLLATIVVGSLIVRELRTTPAARQSTAAGKATWTVPPDAVSVPALMLGEGNQVTVGDTAASAALKLGGAAILTDTIEEGPLGRREIRAYDLSGTRFIVVLEPFERKGVSRVAAIYLR